MENIEYNSTDGSAGKDESSEKITLRLPPGSAQKIRDKAIEWQVSQSVAAARLLAEETVSPHARPLIQGASADPGLDDGAEQSLMAQEMADTWEKIETLHAMTGAIEARLGEINRLQNDLTQTLKTETTTVTKATQNFSVLGEKSSSALKRFDDLEKKFLGSLDVQKKTVEEYLTRTRQEIISAAFAGHDAFEERVDKKLRAAERLIERANNLDSSFANYFTNGVQHFLPEVERLKGSIERDLRKIKIFNGLAYAMGGLVFLLGIAAVTYYRPVLDLWDKNQVATAATKSVTEAFSKQLTEAQNKLHDLEYKAATAKRNNDDALQAIKDEAKLDAQKEVENYRIKAFEKASQRYEKDIEAANRYIGNLKQRLAEGCRFFCTGDYSGN